MSSPSTQVRAAKLIPLGSSKQPFHRLRIRAIAYIHCFCKQAEGAAQKSQFRHTKIR
ncbi:hypothetical protein [Phormidesmis priestleyi]